MRAWIAAQLADPTNVMHGVGIVTVVGEVLKHWATGNAVDPGTIMAGIGCSGVAGLMDHFGVKGRP